MLRRPPEAIIVAHQMDPGRRELYVEGVRDRAFLRWLIDESLTRIPAIIPVDLVDVPEVEEGGNRERLKTFLSRVADSGYDIRGFLDADQGRLTGEAIPSNAWLTDLRDIEGYVLSVENVDAALRLGCGITSGSTEKVLDSTFTVAQYLAAVRLASYRLGLRLPVSKSEFKGFLRTTRLGIAALNERQCLSALLQAARISLKQLEAVARAVAESGTELADKPRIEVVHGKDCMKLLTRQFRAMGALALTDAAPIIWSSAKRERLSEFSALQDVIAYLKNA